MHPSAGGFDVNRFLSLASLLVGLALISVALPARADAVAPRRILIAVGHSEDLLDETALKHTKSDADRVRDVFVRMGRVVPSDAIVLENPSASALVNALGRAKTMAASSPPDQSMQVFFYFSGHGDRERLHLGSELFPIADLSARLADIPAQLRVVVTDACRTTNVRNKGGTVEPGFAISLSTPAEAVGSVWLYASADGEAAQESDELHGAIFTHHLLNGLSGAADANGDRRVSLEEAYAYAHGQTMIRSFRGSGTVQRPSAKFDVNRHAPLTITEIPTDRATVRVPQARDIYYLVSSTPSRSVVAELWSNTDRMTDLSLPPGKYVVQRRAAGQLGYLEVDLGKREARQLSADDFRAMPVETLSRKGSDPDTVVSDERAVPKNVVALGYGVNGSSQLPRLQGIYANYTRAFGSWSGSVVASGTTGERTTASNEERLKVFGGAVLVGRHLELGPFTIRAGMGPSLRYVVQDLTRANGQTLALVGQSASSTNTSVVPGGMFALDAEHTIATRFVVRGRGEAAMEALSIVGRTVTNVNGSGLVELGVRF